MIRAYRVWLLGKCGNVQTERA